MSERKYRQRGYMEEEPRERRPKTPAPGPARQPGDRPEGPKTPNLMSAHEVVRCARCGNVIRSAIASDTRCTRCGTDLHSCAQCTFFDPGARFQCMKPVPVRVAPKDTRNDCPLFEARTTIERETHSTAPSNARTAFDDLFK